MARGSIYRDKVVQIYRKNKVLSIGEVHQLYESEHDPEIMYKSIRGTVYNLFVTGVLGKDKEWPGKYCFIPENDRKNPDMRLLVRRGRKRK